MSRKAQGFREALAQRGIELEIPAMDDGDFERLTITVQLRVLEREIRSEPVCLVTSSMGGLVGSLYAAAHPEVSRLVLLAPAFGFAQRWHRKLGPLSMPDFEVFHHGEGRMRRVNYGLIEDGLQYPDQPDFVQPALIFHGIHDETVPIEYSRQFVATHANARLVELESDHELLNVLDLVVDEAMPFLMESR
jgi:hypothetical protein